MNTERDQPDNGHLDAETLAAWVDGGLDPRAAAMAESHVSSCDRCQEIVALISQAESVHAAQLPVSDPWYRRLRAAWLVPLTAGVAAVGLWMIVPANRSTPPPVVQEAASKQAPADLPAAPPAVAAAPAEALRDRDAKRQQAEPATVDQLAKNLDQRPVGKDKAEGKELKLADQQGARAERFEERTAPAAPARSMAAPAPAAEAVGRLNLQDSREITSPDPRTRWRLVGGATVEYSQDSGATWISTPTGVTEPLTAGSSPSADVCWLVGRNGSVLLTTDGRRWQRVAFPEALDLTSVRATDARSAQVTAASGAVFRTADAGATWKRD